MLGSGLNPQLDHLLNGLKELRIECDEGDYLDYVTATFHSCYARRPPTAQLQDI